MGNYICPKCGNTNPKYIGYIQGKAYCRFCISMHGEMAKEHKYSGAIAELKLDYSLSKEQKEISERVIYNYKRGYDTLINAVCGAGKTELVYGVIEYALKRKQAVAFAIPRKDVAKELYLRIKSAFPNNSVTSVYGGHTSLLEADIVVLTTHQLYRYEYYFDLIVLDEIDAFPYNGNELLNSMFIKAQKGNVVMLSATPSKEVVEKFRSGNREILELNTRFHRQPLPVPSLVIRIGFTKYIYLIKKLKKFIDEKKPTFVFTPTIEIAEDLYKTIKPFIRSLNVVHSKSPLRAEIIEDFRKNKFLVLITTAVLERGVTIKNLQVIIFRSDHELYNEYNLVQISGRVGRKFDAPYGEVIFLADKKSDSMLKAKETIISKNKFL